MSRCVKFQQMIKGGEWEQAVRELNDEYAADPDYTGALYNLGLAFEEGGLSEVARACYSHYLTIDPDGYWADASKARLDSLSG